ncbi:MAG: tryptophan--tRNA ligase [Candidatus Dojkabacteria bacterium]|nr:tryptophan--tRNA ligase [Candidatus Dojkabacteria bacterium]
MKISVTGIKPTGNLHLGHYSGVISQIRDLSRETKLFAFVADLHAMTVPWEPQSLKSNREEIVKMILASDINLDNTILFLQSDNPDHTYLSWIFEGITAFGRLKTMIEFKELSQRYKGFSVGIFTYPVLMAADILLYNADYVPVGEDQRQHVELTADIARKFNQLFGETFTIPQAIIRTYGRRIKSLQDPTRKMSKSIKDPLGTINLSDDPDEGARKILKAVTDSENEIRYDEEKKPGISNLIEIYSILTNIEIDEIVNKYNGSSYKALKEDLASIVKDFLSKLQTNYKRIESDMPYLRKIIKEGANKAMEYSSPVIKDVKRKVGLYI